MPRIGGGVGGKIVTCVLCGRRRKQKGHNIKRLTADATFSIIPSFAEGLKEATRGINTSISIVVKAGEPICWMHEQGHPVYPPDSWYRQLRIAHDLTHSSVQKPADFV